MARQTASSQGWSKSLNSDKSRAAKYRTLFLCDKCHATLENYFAILVGSTYIAQPAPRVWNRSPSEPHPSQKRLQIVSDGQQPHPRRGEKTGWNLEKSQSQRNKRSNSI